MSLISYNELCSLVEQGIIEGVKPEAINGTSIDVHLGPSIMVEDMTHIRSVSLRDKQALSMTEWNISGKSYMLLPGEFILAHTVEKFNLPDNISAEFKLNSSGARVGLENALATWCFVKGTMVATLDGKELPIEDIKEGTWIYATDKDGRLVPAKASSSRMTKTVKETVRVTLDNGKSFECTPDHKILLRNNEYCRAEDLVAGNALMPFTRRMDTDGKESIYRINPGKVGSHSGKWVQTHRLVAEVVFGEIPAGHNVHHKDLDPSNNVPENLVVLSNAEHIGVHAKIRNAQPEMNKAISLRATERNKRLWSNPEWVERKNKQSSKQMSEINKRKWATEEHREKMRPIQVETAKRNFSSIPLEERSRNCKIGQVRETLKRIVDAGETVRADTYIKFKRQNWPTIETLERVFGSFTEASSLAGYDNHKVISVEKIVHENAVPVYDITVPEYSNFSLSCGAIVHNCDPHWHGSVLTLELKNLTRSHIIELHDGCRIGQMIFHKSEPVPREKGYAVRGRYNQDTSVSGVKEN